MDLLQAALFPALIVLFAGVMIYSHLATWRDLKENKSQEDAADHDFRRRQCRRRLQASSLLALVGVAMFVGQLIDAQRNPSFFVFYWCAVALLVLWVVLLALADVLATRFRLGQLRQDRLIETAKLQAQLRIVKARQNGTHEPPRNEPQVIPPAHSGHHEPGNAGDGLT